MSKPIRVEFSLSELGNTFTLIEDKTNIIYHCKVVACESPIDKLNLGQAIRLLVLSDRLLAKRVGISPRKARILILKRVEKILGCDIISTE